jgi:ribonuclease HI
MGYAAVIVRDGKIVKEMTESGGQGTNNQAEMRAVLLGLEVAKDLVQDSELVTVISDSELAIGLLAKNWRSKNAPLLRLRLDVRDAEKKFSVPIAYEHGGVDDEMFQLVDVLAREAARA